MNNNYEAFIQGILNTRGRFGVPNGEYKERHHILPKCCGGGDEEENLIDLYAHEHFTAHRLLAEENPANSSLVWAFHYMCYGNKKGGYNVSEEDYSLARDLYRQVASEKYKGEGNPHFGIHTNYGSIGFTGRSHTEDTKKKMSDSSLWRALGTSNRAGCKISEDQQRALKEGKLKIPKELLSDAAKLGWETRRSRGTTKTTNGRHWYNNGVDQVLAFNCPDGFVDGMLKKDH